MNGNIIEKNVKTIFSLVLFFLMALLFINFISALANPATVYCNEMNKEFGNKTLGGYNSQLKIDANGNEYGVCIVNKTEFKDWDFYEGKVGKEYSYCAKTVCKTGISDAEAMNISSKLSSTPTNKKLSGKKLISEKSNIFKLTLPKSSPLGISYNQTNYTYWDWKSPPNNTQYSNLGYGFFDNSNGWLTSVKNQGGCGSCWSFGIDGAIESRYEINNNNSRLNPDLSEQNSVSCDHSCYAGHSYPDLNYCNSGCDGGWLDLALNYIKNTGAVDENCYGYTGGNGNCSNRCSNSASRTWTIAGADYSSYWTDFTNSELEQWILDNGPSPIGIYAVTSPTDGFMNCGAGGDSNHAVVLVGYNDTGNITTSYWILKNSWGSGYGMNGYFKIKFNDNCNVGTEVYYINTTTPPEFKPAISLTSPVADFATDNSTQIINFNVSNRVYSSSTCDLIIDNILNQTNSTAITNTTTSFIINNLGEGQHNISVNCWENELGIVNSSVIRSILIRSSTISTSLNLPTNNLNTDVAATSFNCSSISNINYDLINETFYLWNSSLDLIYNETKNITGTINSTIFNYSFTLEDSYKWNCMAVNNISDFAFNTINYTLTYDITPPTSPSSSGGGGGGGTTSKTYTPSLNQILQGYSQELKKDDKIDFNIPLETSINSGASESPQTAQVYSSHTITINKVIENYANITIRSNPINLIIRAGEEKKLNLTSSDYYDLYIKLNSIKNNNANLTIRTIYELIKPSINKDSLANTLTNTSTNQSNINSREIEKKREANIYIYILIIVIIAIILAYWFFKKPKSEKPIKKRKNKENNKNIK